MPAKNKKLAKFIRRAKKPAVAALLVAAIAIGAMVLTNKNSSPATTTLNSGPSNDISPANRAGNPKGTAVSPNSTPKPAGLQQIVPVITSASQEGQSVVVRAYVAEVFENGGACTATFTKSGQASVSGSSVGFQNASYTTCPPIKVSRGKFLTAGNWTLALSYKSSSAEGSTTQQITLQ